MIRVLVAAILLLQVVRPALALEDADYAKAIAGIARAEIVPAYQALEVTSGELGADLDALCATPNGESLNLARAGFADVVSAWARVQFIAFGPIAEHQRAFRIEYWPDKRNVVGRQLTEALAKQDEAALDPDRFATTTVGIQGLPALERLLFDDTALARVSEPDAAFRCKLMIAIASNLETIGKQVVAGWSDGAFLGRIEHPSEQNEEMPTGRDAAIRLLNDLLTATIVIRDMKLLAPLGDSRQKAKPQAAEFWRSGQSIASLSSNLRGLRALFGGDQGLGGLLRSQPEGEPIAQAVLATLDQAIVAADAIALPLDQAVREPEQRKKVEMLAEHLMRVRDLLAGPVATNLKLPIGFNALDGD